MKASYDGLKTPTPVQTAAIKAVIDDIIDLKDTLKNSSGTGSSGTGSASKKPTKSSLGYDIKDTFLKNIMTAIILEKDKYPNQYNTVVQNSKDVETKLKNIVDANTGELKKLSNNIQKITQDLIKLKYIEPKLTSVKIKPPEQKDLLVVQYSWILESAKDVGKEFPVLSAETKELYEKLKKNALKTIDDKNELSPEKIKDAILDVIATPKAMVEDKKLLQVFLNITSNEKNVKEFLEIFKRTIKPSTNPASSNPTDNNARACVLLSNFRLFIGIGDEKEDILDLIKKAAKEYDPCDTITGQSFYIPSSRGRGAPRGAPGGTGAQRGPYVPPGAFGVPGGGYNSRNNY